MSFDNTNLTASRLQWLGLSAEDMLRCWKSSSLIYDCMFSELIPVFLVSISAGEDSHLPLTPHDVKKGFSLLKVPGLDSNLRYIRTLQKMGACLS